MLGRQPLLHIRLENQAWGETGGGEGEGQGRGRGGAGEGKGRTGEDRGGQERTGEDRGGQGRTGEDRGGQERGQVIYIRIFIHTHCYSQQVIRGRTACIGLPVAKSKVRVGGGGGGEWGK